MAEGHREAAHLVVAGKLSSGTEPKSKGPGARQSTQGFISMTNSETSRSMHPFKRCLNIDSRR